MTRTIPLAVRRIAFAAALALFASGPAMAADPAAPGTAAPGTTTGTQGTELTPTQRQAMAQAHRQMADCLEANKPWAECHAAMQASCQASMGAGGCMMGGGMGMGRGMGRGMGPGMGGQGGATAPPATTP